MAAVRLYRIFKRSSRVTKIGRFFMFMVSEALVGKSWFKADSRRFIFNSWPIVRTDTSKFLFRAEPNTSLLPTDTVDPILVIHSHTATALQ